jgi:hypothetical protein
MPYYTLSPYKPAPKLLVAGRAQYLFGSFDDRSDDTVAIITADAAAGTTATLTVTIIKGSVPVVGQLITVIGTVNSAGVFNVTNTALSAVTAVNSPDNGVYLLSYTISATTQATTADIGQALMPQQEIGTTLIAGSSAPVAMPYGNATSNLNQAITVVVSFPSLPTSVIVVLQQAVIDRDSEYATVATVATVSGGAVTAAGSQITVDPTLGKFFRLNNGTVVGGTLPTIIGKILM